MFWKGWMRWITLVAISGWNTNDEHYSWWSSGSSICYLPQRAGYEPLHENRTWALPQGNPSLSTTNPHVNQMASRKLPVVKLFLLFCLLCFVNDIFLHWSSFLFHRCSWLAEWTECTRLAVSSGMKASIWLTIPSSPPVNSTWHTQITMTWWI